MAELLPEGLPFVIGLFLPFLLRRAEGEVLLSLAAVCGILISAASGELSVSFTRSLVAVLVDGGIAVCAAMVSAQIRARVLSDIEFK